MTLLRASVRADQSSGIKPQKSMARLSFLPAGACTDGGIVGTGEQAGVTPVQSPGEAKSWREREREVEVHFANSNNSLQWQ